MSQRPTDADDAIDRAIRDVPVPAGLESRVAPGSLFSDRAIDRVLAAVAIPAGLVDRLRDAVQGHATGAGAIDLDRAAVAVSSSSITPRHAAGAGSSGRRPPLRRRGRARWLFVGIRDAVVVASLLTCVAGMFHAGMEVSEWLARDTASRSLRQSTALRGARPVADGMRDGAPTAVAVKTMAQVAHGEPLRSDAAVEAPSPAAIAPNGPDVTAPAPAVLGAAGPRAIVGDSFLRHVALADEPRRRVPRDVGFDIAFEIQHGESPFVAISPGAALAVDQPPLAVRTDSFDALRAAVRSGRRQLVGSLRAEHVLAALPAPPEAVDAGAEEPVLAVHAVRSLRDRPSSVLVEVAVTAPSLAKRSDPPLEATIILDRSAGAASPAAWGGMCRGLAAIASQLRPIDRLSVVVAGTEPALVANRADAQEIRRLARVLEDDVRRGPVDLDAAMRLAVAPERYLPGRVIVISRRDSLERAHDEARTAFVAWQRAAASGSEGAAEQAGSVPTFVFLDPAAAGTAGTGPGELGHVPADSVGIRRGMLEAVFSRAAITLRQGVLRVEFDPARVAAYRIIGHRHSAVDSVTDASVEPIDLLAGETARVVYEVVRTRKPPADSEAAWLLRARFEGRLPVDGDGGRISREIVVDPTVVEAASPLPSPHGCELILAVELGELAAGSVHAAPTRRNPRAVAALVREWQTRGDVTPFASDVIVCLERQRGGARRTSGPFDVR